MTIARSFYLLLVYRKAVLKKENAAEYKELGCSWALCQAHADGYIGFRYR